MLATRLRATALHRVVGAAVRCWRRSSRGSAPSHARLSASRTAGKRRRSAAGQRLRKKIGLIVPGNGSGCSWGPPMAMTATERSRVLRERRASGKIVLTVVVSEDELGEIARAGYAEAASADREAREAAVSLFLSDMAWGLMQ
jgi:hypothetical protein